MSAAARHESTCPVLAGMPDESVPQGKMDMLAETQAAPGSGNSRGPTETTSKESHGMNDRTQNARSLHPGGAR